MNKKNGNIVKANDLIQKSRYSLTLTEQKILLRLIQMVQPSDDDFQSYLFSVKDFCELVGIDNDNGRNYDNIKRAIQNLADKSFWLKETNGNEIICRWISKAKINKQSGIIELRLDDDLKPYLLNLKKNFTQYSLYSVIGMRSKYSIRLYEYLKSEQWKGSFDIDIDELKQLLDAETYTLWANLKQKVIGVAVKEINLISDIVVEFEPIKTGRKITKVKFSIREKTTEEIINTVINKKCIGVKGNE